MEVESSGPHSWTLYELHGDFFVGSCFVFPTTKKVASLGSVFRIQSMDQNVVAIFKTGGQSRSFPAFWF